LRKKVVVMQETRRKKAARSARLTMTTKMTRKRKMLA